MTTFQVTIDDPTLLAGIDFARQAHNNNLNVPRNETVETQPDYCADSAAYVTFVLTKAASSYAKNLTDEQIKAAAVKVVEGGLTDADIDAAIAAKVAKG